MAASIHSHRAIVAVLERLARLADAGNGATRRRINDSFQVARNMHTNFYENELPDTIVRDGLQTCGGSFPNASTSYSGPKARPPQPTHPGEAIQ